jgi:hypothetical protein
MHASKLVYFCQQMMVAVWGTGLVNDDDLKLRSIKGVNHTFVAKTVNPYLIEMININPALVNFEIYEVVYGDKVLIQETLSCPNTDYSGIFYIDNSRQRSLDVYTNVIRKIPNPTIRTAFFGE